MELQRLLLKIDRMYAALGSVVEPDLSKFPPTLEALGNAVIVRQDFNQGLNRAELENKAFQVIRSIADMKDHLRAYARRAGSDPEDVERAIDGSTALQLMIDLANHDKHGAHDKAKRQRSGKSPRLVNVRGAFMISARGGEVIANGGRVAVSFTARGVVPIGPSKSAVVITGEIVDGEGKELAALQFAQASALEAWEALFASLSLPISRSAGF